MLTLTSENRARLIHVLEAELPHTKPPLQDLCSALLTLLIDHEALLAAVRGRMEIAADLASELQEFLDDTDDMRVTGDTLHTMVNQCLADDEVRKTAGGLLTKLQACLEGSEAQLARSLYKQLDILQVCLEGSEVQLTAVDSESGLAGKP